MFDMELYLPAPDGGDDLHIVTCDVDPFTLEVVGTVEGRVVELDEYQQELARDVAGERIDWRRWTLGFTLRQNLSASTSRRASENAT